MPRCAEGIQVLAADYDLKLLQVESATTCTPAAEYATRRCGVTSSATGAAARPSSPGTCVGSARRRLRCVVEARVQVLDDAHGFGTARRRSGLEHRDQAEELVVIVLVDGELAIAANSIFGRSTQSIACDAGSAVPSYFRKRLRSTADGLSALPKQRPSQRDALALASAGGLVLCDAHQLAQRLGLCLRYVRPE